mmetsp:Transcript_153206/g.489621  ORF Transcript_153206/g.489621 Transcript_153206/m.489621 type:complete len:215 (-) Transcript_153206:5-649(-)
MALLRSDHSRQEGLAAPEMSKCVHLKRLDDVVVVGAHEVLACHDACVVDQDGHVPGSGPALGVCGPRVDLLPVGDVDDLRQAPGLRDLRDQGDRLLHALLIQIPENQVAPVFGELQSGLSAHAVARSRDQADPAREILGHNAPEAPRSVAGRQPTRRRERSRRHASPPRLFPALADERTLSSEGIQKPLSSIEDEFRELKLEACRGDGGSQLWS